MPTAVKLREAISEILALAAILKRALPAGGRRATAMTEIISFVALPFDFTDGGVTAGEPIDCPSPAAAIERAQGLWKVFGHAGSVAFSRTTDFELGKFNNKHVLRRFGQVADEYR
jgi:hypothetical protein